MLDKVNDLTVHSNLHIMLLFWFYFYGDMSLNLWRFRIPQKVFWAKYGPEKKNFFLMALLFTLHLTKDWDTVVLGIYLKGKSKKILFN